MPIHTRQRRPAIIAAGALVVIAARVSLHCWWNTNVLGAEAFCDGRLDSGDVQEALDSPGRVSEVRVRVPSDRPEFECSVSRTSRFVGGEDQQLTLTTANEQGAFPCTTAVWKNPAARSYFTNGVTGAVSEAGGYLVLPKACWDTVGDIQGSRVVGPDPETVATVEVTVTQESADRAGPARLLTRTARKVAGEAGCSTPELARNPSLSAPSEPRSTVPRSVCGLPGFSLPGDALVEGVAEVVGREQVNSDSVHTWACDLDLAGKGNAAVLFVTTSEAAVVEAALREPGAMRKLPADTGFAATEQAVLHCEGEDVYFGARWNDGYRRVLLDSTHHSPARYAEVRRGAFQNFLDAAAGFRSCPRVTLPASTQSSVNRSPRMVLGTVADAWSAVHGRS
ncbi:hypothetical protein HCJ93_19900 [Streptomyces sp. SBST2-5]|uniref:Secreted protein n=1 Tax=Streptomyces composti TaxID=2720025 RepID=A0ABX1AFC2_9ACTN|nr:hypothetical protein [Streptomyces composti]NJP52253.1 hypothetical protein [Streptomyces composti]